jgi:hypothetical protein
MFTVVEEVNPFPVIAMVFVTPGLVVFMREILIDQIFQG